MNGSVLATALSATATATWGAAAIEMLVVAQRQRSFPDQLLGVALLTGALLLGIDMLPIAAAGPLPLLSIVLALGCLWAFGFGRADGATALLPNDRARLWFTGIGTGLLLHFVHTWFGAQPTVGPGWRPFELPLAAMLLMQARNARKLPAPFLAGPTGVELAILLAAAALAGVVNSTGIAPGLAAAALALGPVPFLVRRARRGEGVPRLAGAVAVAAALVCVVRAGACRLEQDVRVRAELRSAAGEVLAQVETLRSPLDEALASWAVDQPRQNLAIANAELTTRLARLLDASLPLAAEAPVRRAIQAQGDHGRLGTDLFLALQQRELHWDSAERRERGEARARTLYREAQMALTTLHEALASLGRHESAMAEAAAGAVGELGEELLWLLAAVALLGTALCAASDRTPATTTAVHAPAVPVTAAARTEAAQGQEESGTEPLPALRGNVLLVEDSPLHQRLVSHMLWQSGLDVTLADNGPGALQLLENERFDLVLMDVQLPGLDGLAVTARMRERGDRTPVIALSADGSQLDRERAITAGCNLHLCKPVDRTTLASTLATYLPPRATS